MSEPLPVEFTTLAAQQIRTAEEWWRVNRTAAPHALRLELDRALILISGQPRIGSHANEVRLAGVRRVFLPIIKQYLYYRVLDSPDRLQVVALWHVRRGKGPPI
jgi:hypothetical protein